MIRIEINQPPYYKKKGTNKSKRKARKRKAEKETC